MFVTPAYAYKTASKYDHLLSCENVTYVKHFVRNARGQGEYFSYCLYKILHIVNFFKKLAFLEFTGAGAGNVDCVILDPHGRRDTTKPLITKQAEGNYLVEYTPKEEGLHSINVFFAGQQIPGSPFGVEVAPSECLITHEQSTARIGVCPICY